MRQWHAAASQKFMTGAQKQSISNHKARVQMMRGLLLGTFTSCRPHWIRCDWILATFMIGTRIRCPTLSVHGFVSLMKTLGYAHLMVPTEFHKSGLELPGSKYANQ